jgi:hypothetical protein
MACCGRLQPSAPSAPVTSMSSGHPMPAVNTREFEYVGETALTATGRVTGMRYRFHGPGATVTVDARDAPSLSGVPMLRARAAVATA